MSLACVNTLLAQAAAGRWRFPHSTGRSFSASTCVAPTHVGGVQQAACCQLMGWHKHCELVVVGEAALAAAAGHEDGLGAAACHHAGKRAAAIAGVVCRCDVNAVGAVGMRQLRPASTHEATAAAAQQQQQQAL